MTAIQFLGAAGTVTGSKFLVEDADRRVLVDCGLFQGLKELRLRNWEKLPLAPASIDWVVLTHGHIDHTGYLPRLVNDGFRGDVLGTAATADLLRILLPDSGHLQEEEAAYHNLHGSSRHAPALPLYTAEQGLAAAERVRGLEYTRRHFLDPELAVSFARAGHILGSAIVRMDLGQNARRIRIVFSGDLGRANAPILPDPEPLGDADYVVVESTYGDRLHGAESIPEQLTRVVHDVLARGGPVVVPAFAIGRTQELMFHLAGLEKAGRIPPLPIVIDSPMAIDATEIYRDHPEEYDDEMRALVAGQSSPLYAPGIRLARTVEESKLLNRLTTPGLIISASGMATGGRVLHHLRRLLPDPRATVLLVGYQAVGTRGRALQEGAPSVRIFGEDVPVRAHVETVHGLSAHADADGLMRWLGTATRVPVRAFVVHGEPAPAAALASRIRAELGWEVTVPGYGDRVALDTG
jgi:metallo-beta-lactamase family protein